MPALVPLAPAARGPVPICSVELVTRRFYLSHLRAPGGRGSWLFEDRRGVLLFCHNGLFRDAASAARRFAAAHGLDELFVCP